MKKLSLLDKLHRGFVLTCIGVSFLGLIGIGVKGYEYIVYVRPIRKMQQAKYEEELLKEGRGISAGEKIGA